MHTSHEITLPEVALVAGTRAALGIGIGLLIADRLTTESRRAVGWSLLTFGALTTIPLAAELLFTDHTNKQCVTAASVGNEQFPI